MTHTLMFCLQGLMISIGLAIWIFVAPGLAAEGAYPNRPIVFITHSGPGGGMDTMLRRITDIMAKEQLVTQQMRVENVRGGSGAKAMLALVGKKGDDHVLAGLTNVWVAAPIISPDVKVSHKDMTPVALLGFDPNIIVVRADSQFKNLRELLDFAKANPNKLKQAGGSVTSNPNFDRIALGKATGALWDYVAFPSGGEAVTALLGGHVHLVIGQPSDMSGHLKAGTLRTLAAITDERLSSYPQVPTVRELGITGRLSRGTVRGIVAPPAMPERANRYWQETLRKLTQTRAYQAFAAEIELFPKFLPGQEFGKVLEEESASLTEFLREIGQVKN